MKRVLSVSLAMLLILCLAACGSSAKGNSSSQEEITSSMDSSPEENSSSSQTPNPFADCETQEEAEEIAGFSLTVPENLLEDDSSVRFRAMKDQMLEMAINGEEGQILIRKGVGEEDISGDYTVYEWENAIEIGQNQGTVKGNASTAYLAVWQEGDYSYSVLWENGIPLEEMTSLLQQIR